MKTRIGDLPAPFELAGVRVLPLDREVRTGGRSTRLSPRAMQLLLALAEHPRQTLPHDALISAVWGTAAVGDEVLFKAISELRAALDDRARPNRIIETVPKVGYRLMVAPRSGRLARRTPAATMLGGAAAILAIAAGLLWQPSVDGEAERLVAMSAYVLQHGQREEANSAMHWLQQALVRDPSSAEAHALLGKAILKSGGSWPDARAEFDRALELQPDHVLALMSRARVALEHDWDWPAAYRLMTRARRAAPENPMVHVGLAAWHASRGQYGRSIAAARRAVELDPVSPVVKGDLAFYYYLSGDYESVLIEAERVFALEPHDRFARAVKLEALIALERIGDARPVAIAILQDKGANDTMIAGLDAAADHEFEAVYVAARGLLADKDPTTNDIELATILARQGRHEQAIDALARAVANRTSYVPYIPVDPHFRSMATDRRFRALLQTTGHPLATL